MLCRKGYRIGVIDADIGQSDIGPPGTIGLSITDKCIPSFDRAHLYDAYFIGDKTPTGHLLPVVIGTAKMVEKALSIGADGILINTTGYIHGGVARALKKYKIEAVNPTHIIGLSLRRELTPLIRCLGVADKTILLEAPKYIARKEYRDRKEFRRLRMGAYFRNCKEHVYKLDDIILENTVLEGRVRSGRFMELIHSSLGIRPDAIFTDRNDIYLFFRRKIDKSTYMRIYNRLRSDFNNVRIIPIESIRGLYLGLYKKGRFKGVGRLEDINFRENKIVFTASTDIDDLDEIVFGYLLLDENFNEKGSIRPGFLG
jgi:polynucleotide 5'-hydroxyl-kinase GRC3/NOL9